MPLGEPAVARPPGSATRRARHGRAPDAAPCLTRPAPPRRSDTQLLLKNCQLIIPYDEFLCLQHVLFESSNTDVSTHQVDMFYYFELLLWDVVATAKVRRLSTNAPPQTRRVC